MKAVPRTRAKTAYGLLGEIRDLILEEPRRYDQEAWLDRREDYDRFGLEPVYGWPTCGTVACVGGWTETLMRANKRTSSSEWGVAQDILGLSNQQASVLFSGGAVGTSEPQTAEHARAGARHIDRFRRKYAKQLKAKRLK